MPALPRSDSSRWDSVPCTVWIFNDSISTTTTSRLATYKHAEVIIITLYLIMHILAASPSLIHRFYYYTSLPLHCQVAVLMVCWASTCFFHCVADRTWCMIFKTSPAYIAVLFFSLCIGLFYWPIAVVHWDQQNWIARCKQILWPAWYCGRVSECINGTLTNTDSHKFCARETLLTWLPVT